MFETADKVLLLLITSVCCHPHNPWQYLKYLKELKSIRPPCPQELKVLPSAKLLANHVIEVRKLSQASSITAVLLSAIKKKCVLVPQKGQPVDYLVIIPNPYEHH